MLSILEALETTIRRCGPTHTSSLNQKDELFMTILLEYTRLRQQPLIKIMGKQQRRVTE